jgi:exopolysaccharide biosynthesis predicted pyruvyltransferase EpsI/GT2 family glycosyltransferase
MTDVRAALEADSASRRRPMVFSGRVIFDHLPKTAGMAVTRWLRTTLGEGSASLTLAGDHRSLIARFGGVYSVLSAHVTFDRRGLDPRYRYVTLLREPIDRMVSWFHYVVFDNTADDYGELWHQARRFLESDGATCDPSLPFNLYVKHFAAIEGVRSDDDRLMLDAALVAVDRYDVWGLYESMPAFLADVAALIGIPAPENLDRVNVTAQRPAMADLKDGLRARLAELNHLDLEFYAILKERHDGTTRHRSRPHAAAGGWLPLAPPTPLTRAWEGFTLHSARLVGGESRVEQSMLEVDVAFSLGQPVADLVIEFTVRDELGSLVFSTSTTLLDRPIGPAAAGCHRVHSAFMANLPTGKYGVGFCFIDRRHRRDEELATFEELVTFRIGRRRGISGNATISLPATIHCVAVAATAVAGGWRLAASDPSLNSHVGRIEGGSLVSDGRAGLLLFGPYKTVIAGRWKAVVSGSLEPGLGCLRIDVASRTGRVVHAALEVTAPSDRVELGFQLDHPVHDVEIRVWTHELAAARLDVIAIEAATEGNDVHATTPGCYGTNIIGHGGDNDHGIAEGRIAPVRKTATAADPAKTEAQTIAAHRDDAGQRTDGAVARGTHAVGATTCGIEAGRLGELDVDAPRSSEPERQSGRQFDGPGEPRAVNARHADASCHPRDDAGQRLTARPLPSFSIVIATDGRAAALAELLEAVPFLEGPPCEVCVVRGPTEDGVAEVLDAWRGRIKTAFNPIHNLSISRNIGIAMSAGDIVAFLDDDAIPEADWLADLAEAFRNPAVACVGGVNRDRTGEGFQYGYATANRMGQARWDRTQPADPLCVPGAAEFPYTQGTNTAIRRADLEALGGFDEEYDFYLDETDLCCRLVDAGRLIRQLPRAFVHHRSLPSAIRTLDGVTHSLHAVLKNKLYFSLVNNRGHHTTDEALADFDSFVGIQERHLRRKAAASADGLRWLERFSADALRARETGLTRGCSGRRRLMSPGLIDRYRRPFLPLSRLPTATQRHCTFHPRRDFATVPTIAHDSAADGLRHQQELLRRTWAELLPPGSRVALALYPDHRNVGDAAIWWGTRTLLRSLGVTIGYGCDPWSYDPDALAGAVPTGPILLLGGGNFGDVYGNEQGLRIRILEDFPDRPIIQLPQSIWFRTREACDAMASLLAAHRHTTLLLRDAQSLAFARTHFPVQSLLCPDAALALDLAGIVRTGDVPVVALWRRDIELDLALPPLPPGSIEVDWQDDEADAARVPWSNRAFRAVVGAAAGDGRSRPAARRAVWRFAPALWDSLAQDRVVRGCRLLARGRVVITNRLHAHVLCTLLGIPHIVCDTVNGKLSAYRDTWEANDPLVRFASCPDEAVALVETLAAKPPGRVPHAA